MKRTKKLLIICLLLFVGTYVVWATVTGQTTKVYFTCNGSTTTFACTGGNKIPCFANTDIDVYLRTDSTGVETPQALTTDYSVSALNNDYTNGFTVTMNTAPASGKTLVVKRSIALTQEVNLIRGRTIPAESLERTLDRQMLALQDFKEELSRSIRARVTDPIVDFNLPSTVDTAGKYLAVASDGLSIVPTDGTTSDIVVSSYMETVVDDATAAAARITLLLTDYTATLGLADMITKGPSVDIRAHLPSGYVTDGSVDYSTEIQEAIDTGKNIYFPDGTWKSAGKLTMSTDRQRLYGSRNALLHFDFTGDIGLEIAAEWGEVIGIGLKSESTVNKLISIKRPTVSIIGNYIRCEGTYAIYLEDESAPIYTYDTLIMLNRMVGINGASQVGVRLGLNSHSTDITYNKIGDFGVHILVARFMQRLSIVRNTLQDSDDSEAAILIDEAGGGSELMLNFDLSHNYFEENQVCVKHIAGLCAGMQINGNFASRGTASITNSYFYHNTADVSIIRSAEIKNNTITDYQSVFKIDGSNNQQLDTEGNYLTDTTNWAEGTYDELAYETIILNSYFDAKMDVNDTFLSETRYRVEGKNITWRMRVPVVVGQYIEKIIFKYVQTGSTKVTITLYKEDSTGTSETSVATDNTNSDETVSLAVGAFVDPSILATYYIDFTLDNTGTSGYVYPVVVYLRK